jgi:hypothetical protein
MIFNQVIVGSAISYGAHCSHWGVWHGRARGDMLFKNLNGYQQEQQAKPYDCGTKKEIYK